MSRLICFSSEGLKDAIFSHLGHKSTRFITIITINDCGEFNLTVAHKILMQASFPKSGIPASQRTIITFPHLATFVERKEKEKKRRRKSTEYINHCIDDADIGNNLNTHIQ